MRTQPANDSIIPTMGILERPALSTPPLAGRGKGLSLPDMLFTRTQQRVFGILFGQPKRRFYVNEIIELAGIGRGAVLRELFRLQRSRMAIVTKEGRRKLYQANAKAAVFPEICSLIKKTLGFAGPIRDALEPIKDQIDFAFIYGSAAKRLDTATSDIDLMVVSDQLRSFEMYPYLFSVMHELGRTIEIVHYTRQEFRIRNRPDDCFLKRVLTHPTIFLVGSMESVNELCRT